jgi:hypothetical protein
MLLAVATILLQSAASPTGDTAAALEKLKSPRAADRSSAQLFLARNLTDADLDRVRAAAEAGDPETRRRLALAIADDDARISLAVALAADAGRGAAEVGRGALEERLGRWCPGWTRSGLSREDTVMRLGARPQRPVRFDPRTSDKRLDLALDQLDRVAPGAVPVVLDPDLALSDHARETSSTIEAPFVRAMVELARVHRAEFEGFAIGAADDVRQDPSQDGGPDARADGGVESGEPARPWIRVRRAVAGPSRSGSDWITDWCVGVVADPAPRRRAACARAVASTGWPGGIAWLEKRAFAGKDDAALEGVLLAAGRGQVAPSLGRPEVVRDLLVRLQSELGRDGSGGTDTARASGATDTARADALSRALAAAGPIGAQGEDLAAIAAEGLEKLPPREAWSRLAVLEGMRSSSLAAKSAVDAVLASADAPPPLVFQALRARAATDPGSRPARVAKAADALAWAASAGKDRECARLLVALGVPPPTPLADRTAETARIPTLRLAELEWSLFGGDPSAAAPRIVALAAEPSAGGIGVEALADRTRIWVRQGAEPLFRKAIAAARALPGAEGAAGAAGAAAADGSRLDRLEILSGTADGALRASWIEAHAKAPAGRGDLLALGALASGKSGDSARKAILVALGSNDRLDDAVDAAALAVEGAWSALEDETALAFARAVAEVAGNGSKELRAKLRANGWPPRRPPETVSADELDRTLDRSGL